MKVLIENSANYQMGCKWARCYLSIISICILSKLMIHKTKGKRNYHTISHEQPQPCTSRFSAIVFPLSLPYPCPFPFPFTFLSMSLSLLFSNSLRQIKLLMISWIWFPLLSMSWWHQISEKERSNQTINFIHMAPSIIFPLHIYKEKKQDWAFNHRSSVVARRSSSSFCSPMDVSLSTKMSKASFIHQCLHTSLASATGIWVKR